MFESQKPSLPSVNNTSISVDIVPNAAQYILYRVRYVLSTNFLFSDGSMLKMSDGSLFEANVVNPFTNVFKLADGRSLQTSTGLAFVAKNSPDDGYQSSYTGAQLDAVVRKILG